jgi:hypothetical protein
MIKLNLGCGIFYKPGYVNIDLEESEIADKVLDVSLLPYEDNSVDIIEASHIIEHFDIIHLPYILAEWYRVLKPGGELNIETPDLSGSIRKLRFSNYRKQISTMKFLFGIDYMQNIHKVGFTSTFLRKALLRMGFTKIKKKKQITFRRERGIRFLVQKPVSTSSFEKKHFITTLRSRIYSSLEQPDTQFLDAIENNCINSLQILSENFDEFFSFKNIVLYCSSFVMINPKLGHVFLSMFSDDKIQNINTEILDFLEDIDFQTLLMTNWIKSKKDVTNIVFSLSSFYSHWVNKIQISLTKEVEIERMFTYLNSLEKESVDFFSFDAVNLLSNRICNQGIKEFSKENYEAAESLFKSSLRLNPTNVISNLNLARLFKVLDRNSEEILNYCDISKRHSPSRGWKKLVKKEISETRKNRYFEKQPIQYRF